MELSVSEQLMYTTVRIECQYADGAYGTGTGFFFRFLENKAEKSFVPVVITNKHVVKDAIKGRLIFCTKKADGMPDDNNHFALYVDDFEKFWKMHRSTDVDLCAMPLMPLINLAESHGKELFYFTFGVEDLPNRKLFDDMSVLEDIVMIGYPNGIWDEKIINPYLEKV